MLQLKIVWRELLGYTGWLRVQCYYDFLLRSWKQESVWSFLKLIACAFSGLVFAVLVILGLCWLGKSFSPWTVLIISSYCGALIWGFGTTGWLILIERGVEFVDYYHDWRKKNELYEKI